MAGKDAKDQDEDAATPESAPRSKGRLIGMVLLSVALAAGGAVGATFLGPSVGARLAAGGGDSEHDDDGHGGGHGEGPVASVHVIENLVVNPAGTEGTRFLLISIAIDPRRPLSVDALAADDVRLRDALIRVLGGKSVEALVDVATRDTLVEELRLAIEVITGTGTIERVFLPQYVIQ